MENFIQSLFKLLTEKYSGINLTRIDSFEDFKIKQIEDSLKLTQVSKLFQQKIKNKPVVIDVGFGGGFPLLPLAFTYPDIQFLGVEIRQKKINVVKAMAETLGLKNIKFYHGDIDKVLLDLDCIVTMKAVGKIAEYNPMIHHLKSCSIFHFKGPKILELEPEVLTQTNLVENISYELEGTEGRTILVYELKNVPHGTEKFLVKLSDII